MVVRSRCKPRQPGVLENVPRLFQQDAEQHRHRVYDARSRRRGEQGDLQAIEHLRKQPLGDAPPSADGAATLPRNELVWKTAMKPSVRLPLLAATHSWFSVFLRAGLN